MSWITIFLAIFAASAQASLRQGNVWNCNGQINMAGEIKKYLMSGQDSLSGKGFLHCRNADLQQNQSFNVSFSSLGPGLGLNGDTVLTVYLAIQSITPPDFLKVKGLTNENCSAGANSIMWSFKLPDTSVSGYLLNNDNRPGLCDSLHAGTLVVSSASQND